MSDNVCGIKIVEFSGEESARFTRFAMTLLENNMEAEVSVKGREPLAARPVTITGKLVDATLNGYLRYIVVREFGSQVEYWLAGSNSTRSIASLSISFTITDKDYSALEYMTKQGLFIPQLVQYSTHDDLASERAIEAALANKNESSLTKLLEILRGSQSTSAKRECALAIRAFATVAAQKRSIMRMTERHLIEAINYCDDIDTQIAIVEDLGYFGTSSSAGILEQLISSTNSHVRWAAIIAYSRLQSPIKMEPLFDGFFSTELWVRAASLLAVARRVEQTNEYLETILIAQIKSGEIPVRRYAALALSSLPNISDSTRASLSAELKKPHDIDVKGYIALAICAFLPDTSDTEVSEIQETLNQIQITHAKDVLDPEVVWGLEFLAELAILLEVHNVAEKAFRMLYELFDDWRANYYLALANYECAETQSGRTSIKLFSNAVALLRSIDCALPETGESAVAFRLDLIEARLEVQRILNDWNVTFETLGFRNLAKSARKQSSIYARYEDSFDVQQGIQKLSERESLYVTSNRLLCMILSSFLELEARRRETSTFGLRECSELHNILDSLQIANSTLRDNFAEGLLDLTVKGIRECSNCLSILETSESTPADSRSAVKHLTETMRKAFSNVSWPLPARALPVGGIGKGQVDFVNDGLLGTGTDSEPYIIPRGTTPIVGVVATIDEMAPGGSTSAHVSLFVGGKEYHQKINAVEGPTRLDFLLPPVTTYSPIVVRIELEFKTRDCSQMVDSKECSFKFGVDDE
jgi:hypothetical protein